MASNLNVVQKNRSCILKTTTFILIICVCLYIYLTTFSLNQYDVRRLSDSVFKPLRLNQNDVQRPSATNTQSNKSSIYLKGLSNSVQYLVNTSHCHIPELDPFDENVINVSITQNYTPCTIHVPLTTIRQDFQSDNVYLVVNQTLLYDYYRGKDFRIMCSYSEIHRDGIGGNADNKFKLGKIIGIVNNEALLPAHVEFLQVRCSLQRHLIYRNAHAIVRKRPEIRKRFDQAAEPVERRPLSVLMMGIANISRLHLMQAMPITARHLIDSGWLELQGYNKIGDTTFSNLMAILAGYNISMVNTHCNPKLVGRLDICRIVWKDFQRAGYVTAFGEDATKMHIFNYGKVGFQKAPTDYYMRPFVMADEHYKDIQLVHGHKWCLGYSVEHIYQYALDFATTYKADPFFGLFWSNSFGHEPNSGPSAMDTKIQAYLVQLYARDILNNSAVIFFSDPGMRYRPYRKRISGWFEERLPFMWIWLPPWFRHGHPAAVRALQINRNRLTTPYDIHVTLKHILSMSGRINIPVAADSCPNCQSLFHEMNERRSCAQASIETHWCTCPAKTWVNASDDISWQLAHYCIRHINDMLNDHEQFVDEGSTCAELIFNSFESVQKLAVSNGLVDSYIIVFETMPNNNWFEATVEHNRMSDKMSIPSAISRLSYYDEKGNCTSIDSMRGFCYCKRK